MADALELPLPSWGESRVKALVYLWMIRLFTRAALFPLTRPLLVQYFKLAVHYFHMQWAQRHPTRMAKAVGSSCSFAMVTKQ